MAAVTSTHHNGRDPAEVPSIPLSPEPPTIPADQSIGDLVRDATTHLSTLVRSEIELAKAEVVTEARKGMRGSLYFLVALSILLFSLFFLFFTIAEVLDIWLPRSAAFGIVFFVMLAVTAVFALLGYVRVRSIRAPERTINSVRDSAAVAIRRQYDADDRAERGPAG